MNTFSCRAECAHDTALFEHKAKEAGIKFLSFKVVPDSIFPDVDLEMKTAASHEDLLKVLRKIPDTHVIIQTLRPCTLADNSLERDPSFE